MTQDICWSPIVNVSGAWSAEHMFYEIGTPSKCRSGLAHHSVIRVSPTTTGAPIEVWDIFAWNVVDTDACNSYYTYIVRHLLKRGNKFVHSEIEVGCTVWDGHVNSPSVMDTCWIDSNTGFTILESVDYALIQRNIDKIPWIRVAPAPVDIMEHNCASVDFPYEPFDWRSSSHEPFGWRSSEIPTRYKCHGNTCVSDITGTYGSYGECISGMFPSPVWRSINMLVTLRHYIYFDRNDVFEDIQVWVGPPDGGYNGLHRWLWLGSPSANEAVPFIADADGGNPCPPPWGAGRPHRRFGMNVDNNFQNRYWNGDQWPSDPDADCVTLSLVSGSNPCMYVPMSIDEVVVSSWKGNPYYLGFGEGNRLDGEVKQCDPYISTCSPGSPGNCYWVLDVVLRLRDELPDVASIGATVGEFVQFRRTFRVDGPSGPAPTLHLNVEQPWWEIRFGDSVVGPLNLSMTAMYYYEPSIELANYVCVR